MIKHMKKLEGNDRIPEYAWILRRRGSPPLKSPYDLLCRQVGNCCGAHVLYGFPKSYKDVINCFEREGYETSLFRRMSKTKFLHNLIDRQIGRSSVGMYVIYLSKDQAKEWNWSLTRLGWKRVSHFYNPTHRPSTEVFMYAAYNPYPKGRKTGPVRKKK